jgi:hypothetical protein
MGGKCRNVHLVFHWYKGAVVKLGCSRRLTATQKNLAIVLSALETRTHDTNALCLALGDHVRSLVGFRRGCDVLCASAYHGYKNKRGGYPTKINLRELERGSRPAGLAADARPSSSDRW